MRPGCELMGTQKNRKVTRATKPAHLRKKLLSSKVVEVVVIPCRCTGVRRSRPSSPRRQVAVGLGGGGRPPHKRGFRAHPQGCKQIVIVTLLRSRSNSCGSCTRRSRTTGIVRLVGGLRPRVRRVCWAVGRRRTRARSEIQRPRAIVIAIGCSFALQSFN